jgi:tryptophanyl-tRNA synthetase
MAFKERIFSGVQPTGNLHLGNYLGAITKFVALQDRYDCIYCVVDLHAITVWQEPNELPRATREVTAAFLACGIDPKKNIIFNQSQVAEHAELAWVFNCVARVGWLNRMTQFKEKAGIENASVGLYVYPNLMAADISSTVQRTFRRRGSEAALELSRDIAEIQQRLLGVDPGARLRRNFLSATGADHPGSGNARDAATARRKCRSGGIDNPASI